MSETLDLTTPYGKRKVVVNKRGFTPGFDPIVSLCLFGPRGGWQAALEVTPADARRIAEALLKEAR